MRCLIEECMAMNPKFVPPIEWRNLKKTRKIFIPEVLDSQGKNNYAGMILGENGETQKRLEQKSKCKISIRGRQAYMVRNPFPNFSRKEDMATTQMKRHMYLSKLKLTRH